MLRFHETCIFFAQSRFLERSTRVGRGVRRHSIGAVPRLVAPIAWVRFPVAAFFISEFEIRIRNFFDPKHHHCAGRLPGGSSVGRAVDCKARRLPVQLSMGREFKSPSPEVFLRAQTLFLSRKDTVAKT